MAWGVGHGTTHGDALISPGSAPGIEHSAVCVPSWRPDASVDMLCPPAGTERTGAHPAATACFWRNVRKAPSVT